MVVLPWLVLQVTGSASGAGAVAAVKLLQLPVASVFAGTIFDMLASKRVAIPSDVISARSVAAIRVHGLLDQLSAARLTGLAEVGAVLDPAGDPPREAMLPGAA